MKNIFEGIPRDLRDELFETIVQASGLRIERIVSWGHRSPDGFWYDQEDHEWVLLLKGKAGLRFENPDEAVTLKPGDHIHIERRRRHRVEWTDADQETLWLAVHYS